MRRSFKWEPSLLRSCEDIVKHFCFFLQRMCLIDRHGRRSGTVSVHKNMNENIAVNGRIACKNNCEPLNQPYVGSAGYK